MEKILDGLWVGGDTDYNKIKNRPDFYALRCCKDGPGCHKETLDYHTRGAPKGPEYYAALGDRRMALNWIEIDDPAFIHEAMLKKGLRYVDEQLRAGRKVLIACNAGHSRGPTTAMLYLRSIGELPYNFVQSERIFRGLYRNYDPDMEERIWAKAHWGVFNCFLRTTGSKFGVENG